MADRLVLRLHNAQQAHSAIQQAWAHAKGWLLGGGQRLALEVRRINELQAINKTVGALSP